MAGEPCQSASALLGVDCGEPSIGRYAGACVHEHVRERYLCNRHASQGSLWCRPCFELAGRESHTCDVALALVTERCAEASTAQAVSG